MKKVVFSALALFAFAFSNAQETETPAFGFSAGNILVEGNLQFSTSKEEQDGTESKESLFNFNPKAGYFLTDKFAVGVELFVGSAKEELSIPGTPTDETKASSFGAGVFGRYYFLDLGQRFKTYAEAGLGFGGTKLEENGTDVWKDKNFGVGIDLGINYFITERFAINFGLTDLLSFNTGKREFEDGVTPEVKTSSFEGNFNVFNNFFSTAQFGLTYKF